jgi:integrase
MTTEEGQKLLTVSRLRLVAEFGRKTKPVEAKDRPACKRSRKTWTKEPLKLETIHDAYRRGQNALSHSSAKIAELDRKGRERALIHKTLVLTELRKGELASLTIGDLLLDSSPAWLTVRPEADKAGKGADIVIRDDLAGELPAWIDDRRRWAASERETVSIDAGDPMPATAKLFDIPTGLIRVLDRDLAAAGIRKVDDRKRTLDVHALRHTFCTMLSRAGVAPRTAQQALRHSDIQLTMQYYTDPALLNVAGAVERLPGLPLDLGPAEAERLRATGTDNAESRPVTLAPTLAPTADNSATSVSNYDNLAIESSNTSKGQTDKKTPGIPAFVRERVKGFEPSTYSLGK